MLIFLVATPALLLVAAALVVNWLQVQVRLDPAMILFGLAAVILSLGVTSWLRRGPRREPTVAVNYDLRLVQPMLSRGRYRLKFEIYYEIERDGQRERARQVSLDLQFRRQDHPEILEWISSQVHGYLERHEQLATARFPDARVVSGPPPMPLESPQALVLEAGVGAGS